MAEDLFGPVMAMIGRHPENHAAFLAWKAAHDRQLAERAGVQALRDAADAYTDSLAPSPATPALSVSAERHPGVYVLDNGEWVTADPYDETPLPEGTTALITGSLVITTEQWKTLGDRIADEITEGGDASTLVITVRQWLTGDPVKDDALGITVTDGGAL